MNSKELANLFGCSAQNIRKHAKTAYENNKNYISIKGKKFNFVLVQNDTGKAYEYCQFQGAENEKTYTNARENIYNSDLDKYSLGVGVLYEEDRQNLR